MQNYFSSNYKRYWKDINKNGEKNLKKSISYKLQFTESRRFLASSLSNLVDNLAKGIHKIKCKYGHDNKKMTNVWN